MWWKHFGQKNKSCNFVSNYRVLLIKQLSISTHSIKLMILLLLNMLLEYAIHFLWTHSLEQMRMGLIKHNSVGKQKLLTKQIFGREFQEKLFTQFCWCLSLLRQY